MDINKEIHWIHNFRGWRSKIGKLHVFSLWWWPFGWITTWQRSRKKWNNYMQKWPSTWNILLYCNLLFKKNYKTLTLISSEDDAFNDLITYCEAPLLKGFAAFHHCHSGDQASSTWAFRNTHRLYPSHSIHLNRILPFTIFWTNRFIETHWQKIIAYLSL